MREQSRSQFIRTGSPDRWRRALQRALFAGVDVKQIAGTGEWIVSSASRPGICYRTDGTSCECEAAMLSGDPVCLHRAAFWHAQGLLDLDPEPDPPAPIAAVECWHCHGVGLIVADARSGNRALAACPTCGGQGVAALVTQAAALVDAAESDPSAAAAPGEMEFVGTAGHIAGYDVLNAGDTLHVTHAASGWRWQHTVPNFGTALADLAQQPGLRLGWGRFPKGDVQYQSWPHGSNGVPGDLPRILPYGSAHSP
jgi:hypothetical protein